MIRSKCITVRLPQNFRNIAYGASFRPVWNPPGIGGIGIKVTTQRFQCGKTISQQLIHFSNSEESSGFYV